ncbi:MAG TPA: hypothetical protein DEQ80_08670 [Anaerolinea thermolimosa]|uniref:Uncharacterized protein n=1 Tax=Anaerolinea thermolimosa TaxID=229919 RepID=A0A3D1JI46_9CHLR|nr:hypothetical protein [Anaerolinea thermolimosa]GAP07695.1 hypothetical protein ATHL_02582 [Anaerolinea thermolimosa]HCE17917.1 hypothetical protein [Anaerolinea thermolimosa]
MLSRVRPGVLMLVGFFLMLAGVILPLLMVIKVLESTFLLNFISYGSSLVGMVVGTLGAALYAVGRRRDR